MADAMGGVLQFAKDWSTGLRRATIQWLLTRSAAEAQFLMSTPSAPQEDGSIFREQISRDGWEPPLAALEAKLLCGDCRIHVNKADGKITYDPPVLEKESV